MQVKAAKVCSGLVTKPQPVLVTKLKQALENLIKKLSAPPGFPQKTRARMQTLQELLTALENLNEEIGANIY